MKLTKLTYSKEENRQGHLQPRAASTNEAGEILHLKRLLVTVKQHYEKSLHHAQIQLQAEQNQRIVLQKELERAQLQLTDSQKHYEEELQSLRDQQIMLKELLNKAQEERKQFGDPSSSQPPSLESSRQRLEQFNPYSHDRKNEAQVENEELREELNGTQKKIKLLEYELAEARQNADREIGHLQQLLEEHKQQGDELETVVSRTSSHHLRRELETIKRSLTQGAQESKAIENRYIEILNEKMVLEHQCKQLQLQLEHQSSNLTSFQEQLHEIGDHKKNLENSLQAKEMELKESCQQTEELKERVKELCELAKEKEYIQDKYEQLKEEWWQLSERLEQATEMRSQAEQYLTQLDTIAANQEVQLQEFAQQLQVLNQEKGTLESERDQLKILLDESEAALPTFRLKIAQQHLAKKVKEGALLSEKLEEQQVNLSEFAQTIEYQKSQLAQLQASIDLYQRQEKRLQEQLHEALKGTESQIVKWEEKYFRMYDKWQESENRIRELKKFEEKHLQMQSLLANLGNFMGGAFNSTNALFHAGQELAERTPRSFAFEAPSTEGSSLTASKIEPHQEKEETQEEKYDLFGMKQPPDTYNPHLFS